MANKVDVLAVMDDAALSQFIRTDRKDMREARAAVAELIEDRRILAEAIRAVESTFQPTEGRIGTGRYSFPANGVTADRLRTALARIGAP